MLQEGIGLLSSPRLRRRGAGQDIILPVLVNSGVPRSLPRLPFVAEGYWAVILCQAA